VRNRKIRIYEKNTYKSFQLVLGKYVLHLILILQSVFGVMYANISYLLLHIFQDMQSFSYNIISCFRGKKVFRLFVILIFRKYDTVFCVDEIVIHFFSNIISHFIEILFRFNEFQLNHMCISNKYSVPSLFRNYIIIK
jgi:hypothetical protein